MSERAAGPIPVATTIFEKMSALAVANNAINLGQGFPDAAGPPSVREAAARALLDGPHHYPRMRGTDRLREAIAGHYAATQALNFDPAQGIVVTSGATEALAASILALVHPGDEVVLIQPMYDAYAPLVRRAGGRVNYLRLSPPEWRISEQALRAVITPKTRLILVNDPVNPTGRMLDAAERAAIANVVIGHDLLVIADEVWEEVRPENRPHVSLAADPRLSSRVVKIGSAGKIFQITGWKVGWACTTPDLAAKIAATHQFLTFTTPPALQEAVAFGLENERDWLSGMRAEISAGRDYMAAGLQAAGYAVLPGEATWFLSVDLKASGLKIGDQEYCLEIVERFGVAGIPVSAFFEGEGAPDNVVRFCHAKSPATIQHALERLSQARRLLG